MRKPVYNRLLFVLSLIGAVVSAYLTLAHAKYLTIRCGPSHGCEEVMMHWSAHGFGIDALSGIPTAAFGLFMYLFLVALSFGRVAIANNVDLEQKAARLQWLILASGMFVTGWLTYMEAFVIHAWCRWCLGSASIIIISFIISSLEMFGRKSATAAAPQGEIA